MRKFSDQERATIARRWAASGLPQDQYAASYGVTGRTLRGWMTKFAPSQPPLERAEAVLVEMLERLQTVLEGVRAERAALENRAQGRAMSPVPPPSTRAADAAPFRPERRPEVREPPELRAEVARSAHPRGGSFFKDFRSD